MRRVLMVVAALASLFGMFGAAGGCDDAAIVCTGDVKVMAVRVVDADDIVVAGAEVTATNLDTGEVQVATTGADGFAAVHEGIGGGTVSVVATLGARTSRAVEVEWTCGECHCNPAQSSLKVVLAATSAEVDG